MPRNKYQFVRYQIIDRVLGRRKWVKTKELRDIIVDELGLDSLTLRTVQKDIKAMISDPDLGFRAPIIKDRKHKAYSYERADYTIKTFGLHKEEIAALQFAASSLKLYRDHLIFKDFSNAIDKIMSAVQIERLVGNNYKDIIHLDNVISKGSELIPEIVEALISCKIIKFKYQKNHEKLITDRILEPYLLKEYANRWYLIGKENGDSEIKTFGLDRIIELDISSERFVREVIDYNEYYKYSFGITVMSQEKVENVILSFTPDQGKYIKSLPIHNTQEIIEDNENRLIISIKIIPTHELFEKILSYGSSVEVISPESIKSNIGKELEASYKKYFK